MLLTPVCEQEIKKELENLDPSKSCGHDNIMPKVVKQLATELSEPLSHIINLTFSTGKLPVDFKTSIIMLFLYTNQETVVNSTITDLFLCYLAFLKY